MIGLLTYLPTVAFVPHLVYALIFLYLLFKKGRNIQLGKWYNLLFILLIIGFSIGNSIGHTENIRKTTDYIPYLLLLIISYIAGLSFTKKDAKILVYLIAIECLVVLLEFSMGTTTFFTGLDSYREISNSSSLLYSKRPLGLSVNSSIAALKIFVAILLLYYYKLKGNWINLCKLLLFIGCVLTFNRTVIVAIVCFALLYFFANLKTLQIKKWQSIGVFLLFAAISLGLSFYIDEIAQQVISQFTRNTGKIELAGRGVVWQKYYEYIQHHFLFGNGSYKYLLYNYIPNKIYHAHNSFLQALSTNGIFIFIFYVLLIVFNTTKQNFIYIFSILLYSISQYGIFWGVSLLDIVFLAFLLQHKPQLNLKTHENYE